MKIKDVASLIPVGQRVIVETQILDEKTEGGIVIPESHRQREQDSITEGVLIDYGPTAFIDMITDQKQNIPIRGSKVYFVKYAGRAIRIADKEYRMINDEDIFGFMQETE